MIFDEKHPEVHAALYLRGSDYFSVDGSMSWWSGTSLVEFLTAHTMIQSKMPPNAQGHAHSARGGRNVLPTPGAVGGDWAK